MNNQAMMKKNPEFMDWVIHQDDADYEERMAQPKHSKYPASEWDFNGQFIERRKV